MTRRRRKESGCGGSSEKDERGKKKKDMGGGEKSKKIKKIKINKRRTLEERFPSSSPPTGKEVSIQLVSTVSVHDV